MQHVNPLFPSPDDDKPVDPGYVLPTQPKRLEPLKASEKAVAGVDSAVNLIREKLSRIYSEGPNVSTELKENQAAKPHRKHQQFMYGLSTWGRRLANIQTEWHRYYAELPDNEKHEVWQEFYEDNHVAQEHQHASTPAQVHAAGQLQARHFVPYTRPPAVTSGVTVSQHMELPKEEFSPKQLKGIILGKVSAGGKLKARHHFQSLGFGLSLGFITLVIFMFGFFNEVIIAPFIQPGRTVGATPIIVDPNAVAASNTPEVIIPKINVEIPVDYSQASTNEAAIENGLLNGVVHYPTTALPGQAGNAAFFGHSSNNILNPGKYKFAFVLLHQLVPDDTFYLTSGGKAYVYKVFSSTIVDPSDVGVLDTVPGHPATATLITCD